MNYLLDTHTFIWSLVSPSKLSLKTKLILKEKENVFWVSTITFWEISLKYAIGKLNLKGMKPDEFYKYSKNAGFESLDLKSETAASFYKLTILKNKDPFDLMLAWQAISNGYILLTKDVSFQSYNKHGLKTVW